MPDSAVSQSPNKRTRLEVACHTVPNMQGDRFVVDEPTTNCAEDWFANIVEDDDVAGNSPVHTYNTSANATIIDNNHDFPNGIDCEDLMAYVGADNDRCEDDPSANNEKLVQTSEKLYESKSTQRTCALTRPTDHLCASSSKKLQLLQ